MLISPDLVIREKVQNKISMQFGFLPTVWNSALQESVEFIPILCFFQGWILHLLTEVPVAD